MPTNTIRLPLSALIIIFIIILCVAIGGGIVGSRMLASPIPMRSDGSGTIVPVSQQVTVSPSKLASDIVATYGKSVFLIAQKNTKSISALGTGLALTNDGIIMSLIDATQEEVVGIGEDGSIFPLAPIGYDELSGISFFKASDRIVTPLNVSQSTPLVGSTFLALYRQEDSAQITAHPTTFSATELPSEKTAPGIQKLASTKSTTPLPLGAALMDENGNLAGVVQSPLKHTALFVSDVRSALNRLSSNQLSFNPLTPLGFTVSWKAQIDGNNALRVKSIISSITKNSPADIAGLQTGDILTAIAGNTVSWDTTIVDALSTNPVHLTILRQEQVRQISITP
ncbi:MAG: PDZ domain-containing protein [bacterium]|nr:PDZ domain-containing protein [bacterium]